MALDQGLGELLVDYVVEVCSDPFLTSADPVDAYLMDGRCMQQWAHRALHRSRARLLQVVESCTTDSVPTRAVWGSAAGAAAWSAVRRATAAVLLRTLCSLKLL